MTTIENSRTMRFSRYFANNLEYASKVYMYKPNRKRAKSAPPGLDPDADNKDIETNKKVKKPKEDNTTQTRNNTRQKCATQTDKMEFVDTTTQTYEVDLRDTSAQTDGKIRTSTMQQTDAVLESNSDTSEESTKSDEIKQAFVEYKEIRLEDVKLTSKPSTTENEVSQPMDIKSENKPPLGDDGDLIAFKIRDDPRVVISIPSLSYTFKGDTFDKDWFKEAITAITKRIDRCGVLFDVEDTNIRMIFEEENSVSVPLSFQSPRYHYKCITMSDLQITENAEDTNIKGSITQLLTLEDRTNKNERVSFSPYKKDKQRKIRVPVVLLIMGGDLSALEHVAKALYFDISVVIVTGTGGTADFLDSSVKRKINIRYSLPIIFMQRFEDDIMLKIEEEIDRIHRREWLLTFVEQGSDSEDIFWQKLSDGILRAWAFEKKQDKQDKVNDCDKQEISSTPVLPIAQHVLNEQIYCMMTKTELFGGFVLTQNIQEDESNEEISKIAAKSITNHDVIAVRAMAEKYGNRFLGGKIENAFAEILDDAKPESKNCLGLLKITENAEDTNIKGSITQLLTLEDRTNKNERVSFSPYKKDKQRKIRVPVVLLIMGGDLSALEHVAKALYFDISVVIVTGTGGTADFLDSSVKRKINIRYSLPIIFMQRFEDDIMLKIEEEIDRIHRREWLLTFVEQGSDSEDIFWQKLSDGILRAWAFEKKQDKQDKVNDCDKQEISSTPVLPIAQHVLNEQIYCMMTKTELFGGFVLTQNIQEDESNEEISKIAAKSITNHDVIAVRAMAEKYGNRFLGGKIENAFAEILDDAKPESKNCLGLLKVVHKDADSLTKKGKKANIVETVTVVTEELLKGMWVPMCGKKFSCSCKSSCSVSDVCCMRYQIDDKAEGERDNSNKKQERSKQEAGNSKSKVRQDNDNTEKEVTKEQEKNVTNEKEEEVTKEKQEDVTKEKQEKVTKEKQEEVTNEKQEEVTKEKQEEVTKKKQEKVTKKKQEDATKGKQEEATKGKQEEVTTQIDKKDSQNENKMNKKITSDVTQQDDDFTRLLRMVVLLNDPGSFYLWEYCDYPLQTALLASEYLKSMSTLAEECFEEKLQKDLMKHSNDFKRRAISLLKELHAYNEKMAKQALDHVCKVWDVEESPIRFGHHYGIEEFISHSAAQKDASVRMFALDELPKEIECTIDQPKGPNNTTKTVIRSKAFKKHNLKTFVVHNWNYPGKLMCAPMMRIILHLISFLLTLVLFSIFLTTKLNYTSISVMEGLVFVFMIGELIEEVISMIRPENGCGFSGLWVFRHLCNVWNILDFMFIILYTLAFMLHTAALPSLIVHIRRLYSVSLLFMFLRLLNFFLPFKKIGIIVIMIKEMLIDLLYYLVILFVLLLGAGVVYHANLYPSHDVAAFPSGIDGWRIWTLLQLPFWQVFGDPNLDVLEGTDSNDCTYNESIWKNNPDISRCPSSEWITPVIAAFYMILTNWLLLNIVIAMFSARFEKVKQKASQKWRYYNHSVVIDYEYRYPFPFNIPIRIALWICGFENCKYCKKPKMPNDNKNNTRKHEDKVVDLHKFPFPKNIPCPNNIPFPYNISKQLGRILVFITDKCDCCKSKDSNVPYARVLFLGNERKIKEMLQKQREIAKKIVIQEKLDTNNVQTVYRSNNKLHE